MLSFEENSWNLKALEILSRLNLLPIKVNVETGEIKIQPKRWRKNVWKFSFLLAALQSIYVFARFIQMIASPDLLNWGHFVVHFLFVGGFSSMNTVGYIMFFPNSLEFTLISTCVTKKISATSQLDHVNVTNERGEPSPEVGDRERNVDNEAQREGQNVQPTCPIRIRPVLTLSPQYGIHELFTRFLSFLMFVSCLLCIVILAIAPTQPQLLYSSLPGKLQNVWSFLVLYAFQSTCLAMAFSFGYTSFFIQLQFLEKCQYEFERLSSSLRHLTDWLRVQTTAGGANIQDIEAKCEIIRLFLREIKQLAVLIELFNRVFPFCIFAIKLVYMFFAVFGSFCAIRLTGGRHPFVGCFAGFFAAEGSLLYIIMYEKAFVIPQKIVELKEGVLVAAHDLLHCRDSASFRNRRGQKNPLTWAEVKREVGSFRNVGVRVGSFHTMERMSTPNFLQFVVTQVVSLLVLFPAGQKF